MGVGEVAIGANGACRRVLVKGTLPGERVLARPRSHRRGFTVCRLEQVLEAAAGRVEPTCPAFADCGGCVWQHVDSSVQLARKQAAVVALFEAAGVHPGQWLDPVAGPRSGYRHKARLGVRWVPDKGGALVGFREPGSNKVACISSCEILAPSLARLIEPLRALVGSLDAPRTVPQIEVAAGDDDAALVMRHLAPLSEADRQRCRDFALAHDVHVLLQSGGPATVVPLDGDAPVLLDYTANGITYRFHPLEFTQVNPDINRALMAAVAAHLPVRAGARVLDLFCGIGNFSLQLAAAGAAVTGVEGDAALVSRARENARANALINARFEQLDLYAAQAPAALVDAGGRLPFDVLLLDPPRTGAGALVSLIASAGPAQVGYISCNPETLAADLAGLQAGGYAVRCAGLFDMFPHTAHSEVFAVLERR